jgi:hypothetical protein
MADLLLLAIDVSVELIFHTTIIEVGWPYSRSNFQNTKG